MAAYVSLWGKIIMVAYFRWLAIATAILFLTSCSDDPFVPLNTVQTKTDYFEENDYAVQGEFLVFFKRYGGVESLGYPLTEEVVVKGWRVQYFENGRLEYHPENEAAYRVTVGWLGDLLHLRRPPLPESAVPRFDETNRRFFPQTGHTVSGDFLEYYDEHGGTVRFGLPISEPFLWDGRLTQDFQSARFFWTIDQPQKVILENIGQVHLEQIGLNKRK